MLFSWLLIEFLISDFFFFLQALISGYIVDPLILIFNDCVQAMNQLKRRLTLLVGMILLFQVTLQQRLRMVAPTKQVNTVQAALVVNLALHPVVCVIAYF